MHAGISPTTRLFYHCIGQVPARLSDWKTNIFAYIYFFNFVNAGEVYMGMWLFGTYCGWQVFPETHMYASKSNLLSCNTHGCMAKIGHHGHHNDLREPGTLLLTWFNFNPSIDYIHHKLWDEITYPFPKMDKQFHLIEYVEYDDNTSLQQHYQ